MYLQQDDFPGNCGMATLVNIGCQNYRSQVVDFLSALTDEISVPRTIIAFSGASYQQKWKNGPYAFADWLESVGEKVARSEVVKNPKTKNPIQAFYWVPSKTFLKAYQKYVVAFNKKTRFERDTIQALHYGNMLPVESDYPS